MFEAHAVFRTCQYAALPERCAQRLDQFVPHASILPRTSADFEVLLEIPVAGTNGQGLLAGLPGAPGDLAGNACVPRVAAARTRPCTRILKPRHPYMPFGPPQKRPRGEPKLPIPHLSGCAPRGLTFPCALETPTQLNIPES